MKKISLLYVFLSLFLLSKAQQLDFIKFYTSLPDFQAYDVKQTSDGGYAIVGGFYSIYGGNFILLKTDSLGNQEWATVGTRFDGLNGSNTILSIEIIDNYYYLLGVCQTSFGGPSQIYLVKVDFLGQIVWDKILVSHGYAGGVKLIRSLDGANLLCAGFDSYVNNSHNSHPWFSKIDTSGIFLWNNLLNFPFPGSAFDIKETSNNIFLCGEGDSLVSSQLYFYSFVTSVDTLGNIIWNYILADTTGHGIKSMLIDSANIYAGEFYGSNAYAPGYYNSGIVKLDFFGAEIWHKIIPNSNSNPNFYLGLVKKASGPIFVSWNTGCVVGYDWSGDSTRSFRDTGAAYPLNSVILNSNNKLIETGYYKTSPGLPYISYLARISDSTLTTIDEYKESDFVLFPNPTQNYLSVFKRRNILNKITVFVFDMFDHEVLNLGYLNEQNYFNVSTLIPGFYTIKFISQNHTILSTKKFIKISTN